MPTQNIARMLVRRGPRSDLPVDLLNGQFCFSVDTGELFIGAPSATLQISGPRSDGNIRLLTEIEPFAQPKAFRGVHVQPGATVNVVDFPQGEHFIIFDYGLSHPNSGAFMTSTARIVNSTVHDMPFASTLVVFFLNVVNSTMTLQATNNTPSEVIITYYVRSWLGS